jgi:hypothetical protein
MQQDIIDKNRKIVSVFTGTEPDQISDSLAESAGFHKDYGALMPLVNKCLGICHEEMLEEWDAGFADAFFSTNIELMYKELYEFIGFCEAEKLDHKLLV